MTECNICILCMIGLPGAGKTFLAREIVSNRLGFQEVCHFEFDKLMGRDEEEKTDRLWKEKRRQVFSLVHRAIHSYNKQDVIPKSLLIIIDDNMYYRSMRYEFYRLAKETGSKFCQVFVDTPVEVCCRNNKERIHALPSKLIYNMNEKIEKPSIRNMWEKYSLEIRERTETSAVLEELVRLTSESQVAGQGEVRRKTTEEQSDKHLADLALRRLVSAFVSDIRHSQPPPHIHASLVKVNKLRQDILSSLSDNNSSLPSFPTVDEYLTYFKPLFQRLLKDY